MKPYKFKSYFKETLWGGNRLSSFKGVVLPSDFIGEAWEISGLPGCESVTVDRGIANDCDIAKTLSELIRIYREKLVGDQVYRRYGAMFPILTKFIDAKCDLSLQVHPNDELANVRHNSRGKTEMWYVVKAEEGAKIYAGLRKTLTPKQYDEFFTSASVGRLLDEYVNSFDSKAGDVFFVPAGCLHAIGKGNLLVEIHTACDISYRVYDFDRKDATGQLRKLHVAEARDAIAYNAEPSSRVKYDESKKVCQLVQSPFFKVSRIVVQGSLHLDSPGDTFVIVVCLQGGADLNGVCLRQGETVLVPAAANNLSFVGDGVFLTVTM